VKGAAAPIPSAFLSRAFNFCADRRAELLPHLLPYPPINQLEMGNSRPGCRLEEVLSRARMAFIGSAREARGRTVTPEVAVQIAWLM